MSKTKQTKSRRCAVRDGSALQMEWRDKGRWIKSQCLFRSESEARFHAHLIGAKTFRILPNKADMASGNP